MDNKKFLDYNGLLYFYSLLNSKFLKTETDPVFVALKSNIVSTVELNPSSSTTYSDGYKHIILTETDPTVPAWAKQLTKPSYTYSEVGAAADNRIFGSNFSQAPIYPYLHIKNNGDILVQNKFGYGAGETVHLTYDFPDKETIYGSVTIRVAGINSPAFEGTPTAPTATAGTNSTQIATTAFVSTAVSNAMAGVTSISYSVLGANEDLPQTGTAGVIYLKPKTGDTGDGYDEYIYVNNTYELIGHKVLDLSTYWDETHLVAITNEDIADIVYPVPVTSGLGDGDEEQITQLMNLYLTNYNAVNNTNWTLTRQAYYSDDDVVGYIADTSQPSETTSSYEMGGTIYRTTTYFVLYNPDDGECEYTSKQSFNYVSGGTNPAL